jgi:hypothetical protein
MDFPRRRFAGWLAAPLVFFSLAACPAVAQLLGPEFQVNSSTPGSQFHPAVAADGSGSFVVVWEDSGGDLFGRQLRMGMQSFPQEFQVSSHPLSYESPPAVAVDALGGFVVVWNDMTRFGVLGERWGPSGDPLGREFQVNTYTMGYLDGPAVAADAAGNFVVVWSSYDQDGSAWGVFGRRFDGAGLPLEGEFQVNSHTTSHQRNPTVAFDGAGRFVVAWESYYQGGAAIGVFGQRFDADGMPLGGEFRVNSYTTGIESEPALAANEFGEFVVVWQHVTLPIGSAYADILGRRFDATGEPVGPEFQVNTFTTWRQFRPSVAADGSGDFLVTWESEGQDLSAFGVYAQAFDRSGARLGSEFRVNSFTTFAQMSPKVAAAAPGEFVLTWQSWGQDGSSFGVVGRKAGWTFADGFEAGDVCAWTFAVGGGGGC